VDPWKSFEYLKDYLKSKKFNSMEIQRGSTVLINNPHLLDDSLNTKHGEQWEITETESNTDTRIVTGALGAPMVN
jgi:hypothetical protein